MYTMSLSSLVVAHQPCSLQMSRFILTTIRGKRKKRKEVENRSVSQFSHTFRGKERLLVIYR